MTFYVGMKFGQENNPDNLVAGSATAGGSVDMELRIEAAYTNRWQLIQQLQTIMAFINGNGQDGAGANLPPI